MDPDVYELEHRRHHNPLARFLLRVARSCEDVQEGVRGAYRLRRMAEMMARPRSWLARRQGFEDFDFPGTFDLLALPPQTPDIVHCHNLHGGYFDLQALPWLSSQVPVVLTLHDAWMLSGHCSHSLGCERWRVGCGHCPDLTIPPAIPRDATAYNWQRKQEIYSRSRLFVSTPSRWLMDKVEQSMLGGVEYRVIHNGVDRQVFRPGDKQAARALLGLPAEADVLLFAGYKPRQSPYKDYATVERAVRAVAAGARPRPLVFVCLGERQGEESRGQVEVRVIPYQKVAARVVPFYQAADLYLHAARVEADNFPNTVIEALACGTPVVATAVGGIPEQIEEGVTGLLTPVGDAAAMAAAVERLLGDVDLRHRLAAQAAEAARRRFALQLQVDEYLAWYQEIVRMTVSGKAEGAERPVRNSQVTVRSGDSHL